MKLAPMCFQDYVWPHNPEQCRCVWERKAVKRKLPFVGFQVQDLGLGGRVFRGEGCFAGDRAYEEFRRLEAVFRRGGTGLLSHPQWGTATAVFVALELREEPLPDYVRYRFEFWEAGEAESGFRRVAAADGNGGTAPRSQEVYHTVRKGDTLWAIARGRGMSLSALLALNPQIRNPNRIYPGERVRVA